MLILCLETLINLYHLFGIFFLPLTLAEPLCPQVEIMGLQKHLSQKELTVSFIASLDKDSKAFLKNFAA